MDVLPLKNEHRQESMELSTIIHLSKFKPRPYQLPICKAFEAGYKKMLIVLPRRGGKDVTCYSLTGRATFQRVGLYLYLLPTAVQARRVMFDGITSEGTKMLDFIHPDLIAKVNIQQMKLTLINGSIIQFAGSENYDSLRGTNPIGVVFSEYAFQHPSVYPTLRPILIANDGWAIFISTPNGENHFHTLYKIALESDDWFVSLQTIEDTQHISEEQIRAEIDSGEISYDMAMQEYYVSFSRGATGSFYAQYLNRMELNHQIGIVDWEPNFPVHTAWDLGVRDETVILMFQLIGNTINIIDMYHNNSVGLEHYINVLQTKDYTWGKHIAPHDIQVRDFTAGGMTRLEKAAQLGMRFIVAPKLTIMDGIESVRTMLPRTHMDEVKCKELVKSLRNYRREYDPVTDRYSPKPVHDKASHYADALRYLAVSLYMVKGNNSTPDELDNRFQQARYGNKSNLPPIFQHGKL